jgi:hypothetical protein
VKEQVTELEFHQYYRGRCSRHFYQFFVLVAAAFFKKMLTILARD